MTGSVFPFQKHHQTHCPNQELLVEKSLLHVCHNSITVFLCRDFSCIPSPASSGNVVTRTNTKQRMTRIARHLFVDREVALLIVTSKYGLDVKPTLCNCEVHCEIA